MKDLFQNFEGSKKYHNYTKDIKASEMKALRYMIEMEANDFIYINKDTLEVSDKSDPNALEFLHFYLKGQSFLYNQIRKMVGVVI